MSLNHIISDHTTCVSTEVVLGFTWLSSFNCMYRLFIYALSHYLTLLPVMIYLVILIIVSCVQQQNDRQVWQACVRHYDWSVRDSLGSGPSSPIMSKKPFLLSVPRPVSIPAQTDFSRRMVRGLEKLDPFVADASQPVPPVRQPAHSTLTIPPALVNSAQVQPSAPVSRAPQLLHNITVPSTATPSAHSATTGPDSSHSLNDDPSARSTSSSQHSRPRGRRSPTARRPPPLDLSKITAYR